MMKVTLRNIAKQAVNEIERLNDLFKNDRKQNAIAVIMLAIEDAYRQGRADGLAPKEVKERP